jgi:hypothetical protein
LAVALVAFFLGSLLFAEPARLRHSPEGRFLYTGDDDWDWASPRGIKEPCALSKHGPMPWSALDWAEEGLQEVRGVLVGLPPMVGNDLTLETLATMRGQHTSYSHQVQEEGVITTILAADPAPNLILLTQLSKDGGKLGDEDIRKLADFVESGGRLLVLDDSVRYGEVMDAIIGVALALAEGEVAPPEGDRLDPQFVERVAAVVEKLGSPDFRTREDASAELFELGELAVELAAKMPSEDPEITARITQLQKKLKPKGGVIRNEYRKKKQHDTAERVAAAAARLKGTTVSHRLATVYADAEGAPLATLKLVVPVK